MAVKRRFPTLEQAAAAAGVEFEEISPRAIFKGRPVMAVVEAIRGLEGLKGRERRERLDAIYHGDATARRIVMHHYTSLHQLALAEGIDPAAVATAVYRDEADVQHDLDRLEREWGALDRQALIRDHKRLYNVIMQTGWGTDRLQRLQGLQGVAAHPVIPPCDPSYGPLRNRMIRLRQKRKFTLLAAAREAGVSLGCWRNIERGLVKPSEESERKIVRLLRRNRIPVNTACNP
jgi:DNA-binding XRE family transcriptional regulator